MMVHLKIFACYQSKPFSLQFTLGLLLCITIVAKAFPSASNLTAQVSSVTTLKICMENAARGTQSNRGISAYCDSILNPSIDSSKICKQFPPKISQEKIEDWNLYLSDGVQNMNDQLTSYTSKNSKLGRAIFIMGNSGSGKTTLVQILSKNLDHLYASYNIKGFMNIIENENYIENLKAPSKNLIPDYVVNPESKVAFWDCPSFDDTRQEEAIIAQKYFLQSALDLTTTAKFIFTVSHSAFKRGNDIKEFELLAENVITLFKNLAKLEDSIGLVVTKVERYTPTGKYQSDEQIFDQIHNFLKIYLENTQDLLRNEKVFKQKYHLKKKIQFVKGILGNTHSKLYFLGIPEKCGPLSEMPSILNSRNGITKVYTKMLKYSSVTSKDFQYTLKNDSFPKLNSEFIPKALKNVESIISSITLDLKTQFLKRFYNKLSENLEFSIDILNKMKISGQNLGNILIQNRTTVEKDPSKHYLSHLVENLFKENELILKCFNIISFYELEYRLHFFVKLVNRYDPLSQLFTSFVNILGGDLFLKVDNLLEFYEYCNVTRYELADYSKQKLLTSLQAEDSDSQIIEYISQHDITSSLPSNLNSWNTTTVEDRKYLANVIREILPYFKVKCVRSSTSSEKRHVIFAGNNIKLSEVLYQTNWPDLCKQTDDISEVSVFALERVYFDTDIYPRSNEREISGSKVTKIFPGIEKVEQVKLSIIAPLWKVEKKVEIILNGFQPVDLPNALGGSGYGDWGKNGKAGIAGGNGGTFFGIYLNIENGNLLEISAVGGNGGNGQVGGDGFVGRNGKDVVFDDLPSDASTPTCDPIQTGMEFGSMGANTNEQYLMFKKQCQESYRSLFETFSYSKPGGRGQRGGNGGKGGKGGMSGNAGKIEIVGLRRKSNESYDNREMFKINSKKGSCGKPGLGGNGGKNGETGKYMTCQSHSLGFGWEKCFNMKDVREERRQDAKNGENGEECSRNEIFLSKFQPWRDILGYKLQFFSENNSEIFVNFLNEMDSSGKISDFLTATSFAVEIEQIEGNVYEKGMQVFAKGEVNNYRNHYEIFLEKVKNYTEKFENRDDISTEDKIALNTVFSTVLGKLVAIRRFDSQLNVIKTQEYFGSLIEQMTVLKAVQRQKTIENESKKFKEKLDEKVREAEKFIELTVSPAIKNAQDDLDSANDKLVREINEYINAAEEDVEKKKELKKKLEAAWLSNLIMGAFSFVGSIASMLGPKGKVVGAVINAGLGIAKSIVGQPDVKDEDYKNIEVPDGFKNSMNGVNDQYFLKQISLLDEQTKCVSESVGNLTGNVLHGVESMAENTKIGLNSLRKSINDKNGILDIEDIEALNSLQNSVNDITETVDEVATQLDSAIENMEEVEGENLNKESDMEESSESGKDDNGSTDVTIVKGLATTMKLVKAGGTLVSTIINKKGVKRMEQAIKNAEQHVKDIEFKKAQFYNDVIPVLTSVNQQLSKATDGLPGESQVALSVKKWKIKGMLKNMRGFLTQFTQAMKVTEIFQNCFDTLDEALLLMIELYDHIERYEEKKDLADFIANVNSASSDSENIDNSELKETLTNLNFYINANLFLEDYHKGIHAFKQWAFPFASRYLNETKVDQLSRDLPTVINSYTNQIKDLSVALEKYAATTVEGDQYSMVSFFTSDAVSSEPFYKWSNDNWKVSIKKLLTGETIHLKADVDMIGQESATFFKTKSAIKFKSVAVVVKSRNESRQEELDRTLNHFHMSMKHSGVSLYKVLDQHFVMHDKSIKYHYSFEKTKDNSHVTVNGVKYKVDGPGADFLMSPYTWWTFQISDAKAGGLGFRDLEQFVDEVDLELEGNGVYLEETRVTPQVLKDLKLADYYEVYDSTTKWHFNEESGNKDRCIVMRANLIEAENREPLESSVFLTSLLAHSNKIEECNTINTVLIICFALGAMLFLLLSVCYFYKKKLLGYISVSRGTGPENKTEKDEENELCCLN